MANAYPINPMNLLGRNFDFLWLIHTDEGPVPERFTARVVAVQVPDPRSPVPLALLLEDDAFGILDHYISFDQLHFECSL